MPLAHDYARYFRDGDRDAYEQVVFARQRRLSRAAVLAAATLDPLWIDEVADGVTLLCEQSTLVLAGPRRHLPPARRGRADRHRPVPRPRAQARSPPSWRGSTTCWATSSTSTFPALRARIRYEVDRRVLTPFVDRRDWHWLGLDGDVHNWSAVDPRQRPGRRAAPAGRRAAPRADLVDLVVDGLDRYVASIPADGAIDEGYCVLVERRRPRAGGARRADATRPRGALGAVTADALRETVAFPHRMHLGGDWYLNHADGPARPPDDQPWDVAAPGRPAGRRPGAAGSRRRPPPARTDRSRDEDQGLGRLLRALTDPDWIARGAGRRPAAARRLVAVDPGAAGPARGRAARPGSPSRSRAGTTASTTTTTMSAACVVAVSGVPVLVDAGRPTYTAQTFGPDRYDIWTMQSSWHNVPEIRGTAQAVRPPVRRPRRVGRHLDDAGPR